MEGGHGKQLKYQEGLMSFLDAVEGWDALPCLDACDGGSDSGDTV